MKRTLRQLSIGQRGTIDAIHPDSPSCNLLSAMGLLPGKLVEVKRSAPLGDPIAVFVEGQQISLRLADAEDVTVLLEEGE